MIRLWDNDIQAYSTSYLAYWHKSVSLKKPYNLVRFLRIMLIIGKQMIRHYIPNLLENTNILFAIWLETLSKKVNTSLVVCTKNCHQNHRWCCESLKKKTTCVVSHVLKNVRAILQVNHWVIRIAPLSFYISFFLPADIQNGRCNSIWSNDGIQPESEDR